MSNLDSSSVRLTVIPRRSVYSVVADFSFGLKLDLNYNMKSVALKALTPCCGYPVVEGSTSKEGTVLKCGSCYRICEEGRGASILKWQTPLYTVRETLPAWEAWLAPHLPPETNPLEDQLLGASVAGLLQHAHSSLQAYLEEEARAQVLDTFQALPYTVYALFPDRPFPLLDFPTAVPWEGFCGKQLSVEVYT